MPPEAVESTSTNDASAEASSQQQGGGEALAETRAEAYGPPAAGGADAPAAAPESDAATTPAGDAATTPAGDAATAPAGDAAATPAGDAATTPAGDAAATPAGDAAATPAGDAPTTPGSDAATTPAGDAAATPGSDAAATPAGDAGTVSRVSDNSSAAPGAPNSPAGSDSNPAALAGLPAVDLKAEGDRLMKELGVEVKPSDQPGQPPTVKLNENGEKVLEALGIQTKPPEAKAESEPPPAPPEPPKLEHKADRNQFYQSQMGDGAVLFRCGPSSLYMAARDWHAPGAQELTGGKGFAERPNEQERIALSQFTGTDAGGQFPGGPELMAKEAARQGLQSESFDGNLNMSALEGVIDRGQSVILNAPNHFIYIAGKTPDGNYVVGDPAAPDVPIMTRQDIESRLVNGGRGFTAVWNDNMVAPRRIDAAAVPKGNAAAPSVDRGAPESAAPIPSGGNSSMFEGGQHRGSTAAPTGVPQMGESFAPAPSTAPEQVGTRSQAEEQFYQSNPDFDSSLTDRVVHAISGNEGQANSINWDDAGYGASIGIRQWNQKVGEMPQFMESMYDKLGEDRFKELFPELFKQLKANGMNWESIRDFEFAKDNALGKELQAALEQKDVQQFQLDSARGWVVDAMKLGHGAGFKSEYGLAVVADAVNQAGPGSVGKALKDADLQAAIKSGDEQAAVARMEALLQRPHSQSRVDKLLKEFKPGTLAGVLPELTIK